MRVSLHESEDEYWKYNCSDCAITRECGEVELANLESMGLVEVDQFQQKLFWPVLHAMLKGVRVDLEARKQCEKELEVEIKRKEKFLSDVIGHPLNPRSSLQMISFFYHDCGLPKIYSKGTKNNPRHLTCDDEALQTIAKKEPLVRSIVETILEYRSLGVLLSTFVRMQVDVDDRMRCSYNICGTETYRFSSSKNAFGFGGNCQNIPSSGPVNVKKFFIPDDGMTFFDIDLDRADLQVVVWEAGEVELKEALRRGVDMHLLNAFALLGKDVPLDDLVEGTEVCAQLKHDYAKDRKLAKAFIHGTNYGGGPRTMAIAAGVTVHQAEQFQKKYFGKYPGIKRWHERTEYQLREKHYVTNILGYRRHYFGGIDGMLPEALAWQPQSTVACVINRAWVNIFENLPDVKVLLQVHDSLAGQFPTEKTEECVEGILRESRITLPYEEPLVIPVGIKLSTKSWGDCS